jgi:hypothetical protein
LKKAPQGGKIIFGITYYKYYLSITKPTDMQGTKIEIIGRFTFNLHGLNITYKHKGETTHLSLCPGAICDLLTEAGLIEGFDLDQNGEPVILFTSDPVRSQYGFDRWNSFVCTFPISYRMAVKLLEYRESRKASRSFHSTIDYLLQPLKAA